MISVARALELATQYPGLPYPTPPDWRPAPDPVPDCHDLLIPQEEEKTMTHPRALHTSDRNAQIRPWAGPERVWLDPRNNTLRIEREFVSPDGLRAVGGLMVVDWQGPLPDAKLAGVR